jgi:hypothetical protein
MRRRSWRRTERDGAGDREARDVGDSAVLSFASETDPVEIGVNV